MNLRAMQRAISERNADLVAEFVQLHGRMPKNMETYKGIDIGSFVSRARGMRSRLAMNALTDRGIDYTENMRWPKYGQRRIQHD